MNGGVVVVGRHDDLRSIGVEEDLASSFFLFIMLTLDSFCRLLVHQLLELILRARHHSLACRNLEPIPSMDFFHLLEPNDDHLVITLLVIESQIEQSLLDLEE